MSVNDYREDYLVRLNRVLDYIHANIDQPLPLEVLSDVAGFSPFHFHRLFKALTTETLNDYVQRIRIEKAANLLCYDPRRSILDIAIACGFSGAAVFTRAFRARFAQSPTQYRKNCKTERKQGKASPAAESYNERTWLNERRYTPMDVMVKTLPTYHVAFIRHISGYSKGEFNSTINEAFQRVCGWAGARDLFGPSTLVIGIPYDNPDITPNDRCRYDACVTVPETITEGSGEVGVQEIAGGKYVVAHIDIPSSETRKIGETVDQMYGEWLPSSGYMVDDRPSLEIYYDNPDHPAGTWIKMDYCIPIKPL